MIKFKLYVFSTNFDTEKEALQFAELDYSKDEDNPICPIREVLRFKELDLDYVETIYGEGRVEYLETMLVDIDDTEVVNDKVRSYNTLILVMGLERNRKLKIPDNVEPLNYCGVFSGKFQDL
jgi:hypothetical protein